MSRARPSRDRTPVGRERLATRAAYVRGRVRVPWTRHGGRWRGLDRDGGCRGWSERTSREPSARACRPSRPFPTVASAAYPPCRDLHERAHARSATHRAPKSTAVLQDWTTLSACRTGDPDELFVTGAAQNRAKAGLPRLPRPHRVPRRRARQPGRVRRLGRHDRARAPRPAAPPPGRHELVGAAAVPPRRRTRGPSRPAEPAAGRLRPVWRGRRRSDGRRRGRRRPTAARPGRARRPAGRPTSTTGTPGCARVNRSCSRASRRGQRDPPGVQPQHRGRERAVAALLERLGRGQRALRGQLTAAAERCTRLTTSPASGICSAASRSTKYAASRSASRSGAATTTNAVPVRLEQVVRRLRALPEPAEHRLERRDELRQVLEHVGADDPGEHVGEDADRPAVTTLQVDLAAGLGRARAGSAPSGRRGRSSAAAGASRKSSAERVGGVSTTTRSYVAGGRPAGSASPSPCTPASRRRRTRAPGRRGWPGSRRPCPARRGRPRAGRTSASCRASSRRASRRPATPATARGVLSSSVRPIDWASRRAGSIVSTTVRRPSSAPRSASAAAVVVLPTPPEPQQTRIRLVRRVASMSSTGVSCGHAIPCSVRDSASA